MTTSATSLLGLALPVSGELTGTWGDTVNTSITSLLDTAVAGTTIISTDADVTLTTDELFPNQARQAIILWTAGGTVTRTITAPAKSKTYVVINKTSSTQSIKIVGVGPTTGVTVVAGSTAIVAWNGVDFISVPTASSALVSLTTGVTGILPVVNGGTGATAASGTGNVVLATTPTISNLTFSGSATEQVFALTGATPALAATNGTIQTWTLPSNCTPTNSLTTGQSITLMIDDGAAYTITWPSVVWKTNGGSAPALNTSGFTAIQLWQVGAVLYGARVGNN